MARSKGKAQVTKNFSTLERLSVEYVPTGSLKPNTYNPNRQDPHDFDLLLSSMKEDGFTQPVVCLPDLTIVDGEHRWRAASRLGYAEVPVVKVDMTPEQAKISTLRHNRARGSEDLQLTAEVLRDLERLGALDHAQDSLMMDDVELQRMLEDVPAPEALAADDFSEGWAPDAFGDPGDAGVETPEEVTESKGADGVTQGNSATAAAIEARRERERKIASARNDEERNAAIRERQSLYRLSLMFSGEDADLVRHVFRTNAADRLVEMTREWLESRPEEAPPAADGDGDA